MVAFVCLREVIFTSCAFVLVRVDICVRAFESVRLPWCTLLLIIIIIVTYSCLHPCLHGKYTICRNTVNTDPIFFFSLSLCLPFGYLYFNKKQTRRIQLAFAFHNEDNFPSAFPNSLRFPSRLQPLKDAPVSLPPRGTAR